MKKGSKMSIKKEHKSSEEYLDEGAACKGESKMRMNIRRMRKNYNRSDTEDELYDNRDVVIEDTAYDRKKLVEASVLIRQLYLETEAVYLKSVQDEFNNIFLPALDKMPDNILAKVWEYDLNDHERVPLVIHPVVNYYNNVKTSVTKLYPDRKVSEMVCAPLVSRDKLPPMPYWIHIESNIAVDDNYRLSHVPYLDENQDDETICEGILHLFEEGIHGYSDNWRYINDWMLHGVLNKTLSNCMLEMGIVFFAFYQLFPNKYSHRKLPQILESLNNRWGETNIRETLISNKNKCNDEENKHSNEVKCFQCLSYDCPVHGFTADIPEKFNGTDWYKSRIFVPPKNPKVAKTACSDRCWKNMSRHTVFEFLKIENDDLNCDMVDVFFNRAQLSRSTYKNGSGFVNCFSKLFENRAYAAKFDICESKYCELLRSLAFPKLMPKNESCETIYKLVLQYCHRPSATRLYADRGKEKVDPSLMHKNFRTMTWQNGVGKIENKIKLVPCDHEGPCDQNEDCICQKAGICTKFCSCEDTCKQKFPGCRCKPGQCRTNQCQCFYAKWQCDPDVCKTCNCEKFGDKENTCRNSSIAKGYQKKIKVLPSKIAGWGAFIMEHAEKGELVSEYTGEIISMSEVERRGHVYDRFRTSYIFSLNDEDAVDASKMGNLIRFANHSCNNMNCYPQILVVNGQHRIGIFAKEDLSPGDELLFDYSYNNQHTKFVANEVSKPNKKSKNEERNKKGISSELVKMNKGSDNNNGDNTKTTKRAGASQNSGATKKYRKR